MPRTHVIAIDRHPRRPARIAFDIDFGSGEISDLTTVGINPGYAMRLLRGLALEDQAHFPWQEAFDAPDALHQPRSLALHLMASGWTLEGALSQFDMPRPGALPEGAIG